MARTTVILLPDPADETALTAGKMNGLGHTPRWVVVDYDHDQPREIDGQRVLEPMDILDSDDVEAAFQAAFAWRAEAARHVADPALAATLPAWLPPLTATAIQCARVSRVVAKALEGAEGYAVAGKHPVFPYYRPLIHRVAARLGVPAMTWQAEEAATAVQAPPVTLPEDLSSAMAAEPPPFADAEPFAIDPRAQSGLDEYGPLFGSRWGEPTIVLPMRFRSATGWFHDSRTGQALRYDTYNELYMERLAKRCRSRGWRLAILSLDGAGEQPEGTRTLAETYPGTVTEILPSDFKHHRFLRRTGREDLERSRIGHFLASPAFRQAMVVDGVETHDLLSQGQFSTAATQHAKLAASEGVERLPLLRALRPAAIVGARLEGFPEILRAAHTLGIPSIALRFGIGHEMTTATMDESPSLTPSVNLTWGERPAGYLNSFPSSGASLGPGRPRNDVFVLEAARVDKATIKAQLGLKPHERLLLIGLNCRTRFAEQARGRGQGIISPRTLEQCVAGLADLALRLGDLRIIMKPHESDDMEMLNDIMARHGKGLASVARNAIDGFHNVEILAAADLLIANPSSMMAEAACCGVPSVMLATPDARFFFEEDRIKGYAAVGKRAETVEEAINFADDLLTKHHLRQEELHRALEGVRLYFGPADGYNADRTADTICRIVENQLRQRDKAPGKANRP